MKKSRVLLGAGVLAATAWLWLWQGGVVPGRAGGSQGSSSGEAGKRTGFEQVPEQVSSRLPGKSEGLEVRGDVAFTRDAAAPAPGDASPRVLLRPPALAVRAAEPWRAGLAPRQPLAKEKLHSPPGQVHRLTLKLADRLLARATPAGQLMVSAADGREVAGLAAAADAWSLGFRPVQTASEEQLADLEKRAALNSGRAQPDLGGFVEAVVADPTPERVMELATALNRLPEVEFVEISPVDHLPEPPASDLPPTSSLLASNQTYRDPAQGIDVAYAWNQHNAKGHASLKITDCEYAYNSNHEDLSGLITLQPGVMSLGSSDTHHGTAVFGIVGAAENAYGMTGSAPLCPLYFYADQAIMTGGGTQSRAACVTAALANSAAGDLVMLEMQEYGPQVDYVPAEYSASVWTAVKTGTDAGVIVIAAAGNGDEDLDGPLYQSYRNRGDSGAIIVGAGSRTRERMDFSTYGSRVDVQGWGTTVASTGYGGLATYGGDQNQTYTATFNGTSSATPIVTSAAALLQTMAIREQGDRLSPLEMRTLLKTTGRPQSGDTSEEIGPLPNLAAAIPQLLGIPAPPVVTDNVTTNGAVGFALNFQVTATHSPTSYSASGLPAGLAINTSTGLISGTPTEGGIFSVTVTASNAAGTGSGVLRFDILGIGDAVEAPHLTWTTSSGARWFNQTAFSKSGGDAAASADIGDNGQSWMETTVSGPGTLSFWWKVSSEAGFDFLRFTLDGVNHSAVGTGISGNVDWQFKVVPVTAGNHTLRWTYSKDESQSSLSDSGYVDLVEFHPGVAANVLVTTWLDESNGSLDPSAGSGISLREAIAYGAAGSVIGFHSALDNKTLSLSLGQISVTKSFTIDASSLPAGFRIHAGGNSRIADIQSGRTVTMKKLHFREGYDSGDGGGIRNSGTLNLSDCSFEGCHSGDDGGAIFNGGTLTLTRCTLTGNSADDAGGAILNATARTTTLSECLLTQNIADDNGGAIASEGGGGASVSLTSCVLSLNQALGSSGGGAIDNDNNGSLTLSSCTFSSNRANFSGGAIDNDGTLNATACTFSNNGGSTSLMDAGGGGAIQHISGTLTATNCSFSGNSARYGGAIDGDNTSTLQLVSCTISGNHASSDGGGIEETDGTLNLTHCIVAGNTAGSTGPDIKGQVNTQTGGNLVSSTAGVTGFTGLVAAPQLSPLGIHGGTTATMLPLAGSPAINAGTSASALSTDQRGLPRTQGGAVDLGAVETGNAIPTVIVDTLADEDDGTASGGISLRDALAAATPGSTISFAPALAGGTMELGAGELSLSKNVMIDASGIPGGMVLRAGEGHRVLTLLSGKSAFLKSLVITGGSESGNGGALYNNQGDLVLDGCSVVDNYTEAYGGAIFNTGQLTLLNSTIARNEALESGGGIYSDKGLVTMSGCTVSDNEAWGGHGGGINSQATLVLKQCTFAKNFAYCMGGAIDSSGPLTLDSSTIADNLASFGSIDYDHTDGGGGGVNQHGADFALHNTIIAGNTDQSEMAADLRGTITDLTGTNLLGSTQGAVGFSGIVAAPQLGPLASNGGPTLTMLPLAGSPALNSAGASSFSTDQRGLPRVTAGIVDIGAVEAGSMPPTLIVDTAVDENDGTGTGGVSLRDAVNAAYPGATITFAPALDGATIFLASQIHLAKHVTIDASALADGVSVSGDGITRVFEITAASSATLRKLRIQGGHAERGGGILNAGDLMLSDCEVIDCAAGLGGGVCNTGYFEAKLCRFGNNAADDTGGAIHSQGRGLLMEDSTVAGNGAADTAGGIYLQGPSSVIDRCSIHDNHAFGGHGGGITNRSDLILRSSTLANNHALCMGGGLDNYGDAAILSTTIAGNECGTAPEAHNHEERGGGGVNNHSGAWLQISNSIVGNNADGSGDAPDFRGQVNAQAGVNLFGSTVGTSGFTGLTGDPLLGMLGDNGGPTWTMMPQGLSPVINAAGSSPFTVDQRGMPRVVGAAPDLGAVEHPLAGLVVTSANDSGPGSLRDAVTMAWPGAVITFAPSLSRGTIDLGSGSIVLDRDLTIDASAVDHIEVKGDWSFRILEVSAAKTVTLRNLRLGSGGADAGGGILNHGDLTLERCRITDCNANEGGGIFNAPGAELELLDCRISFCFADTGGGLRNEGSLALNRSVFEENGAAVNGGAVYDVAGLSATRSVFLRNSSGGFAGAMRSSGTVSMTDCTVDNNEATDSGGGLSLGGTAELIGCTISGNTCAGSGGGLVNSSGTVTLKNCTLTGNAAGADYGGAIYTAANLTVESCTISGNDAILEGGGIYVAGAGQLSLRNSIVAGNGAENSGPDIQGTVSSHAGVNLLGSSAGVSGSHGGIVGDPQLLPLGLHGGPTLTMPPAPASPAIDAGGATLLTADQRGLARVAGGTLDIGAVETGNAVPVIVVDTVVDETDGIAVGDVSLRDALQDAPPGATITFAPGLDADAIELTAGSLKVEKNLVVDASGLSNRMGITTAGGYSAIEVGPGVVALAKGLEISGLSNDRDGALANEGELTLEDCLFGGNTTVDGGAIHNASDLTMTDCILQGNEALGQGGGLHNKGTARLIRCKLMENGSSNQGGGIYSDGALHLVDSTVSNCGANGSGGGLYNADEALIERCTFSGNVAEAGDGGGIFNSGSLEILSSTIAANLADASGDGVGGGVANAGSGVYLRECTVSRNQADGGGAGIWNSNSGNLGLRNTIVAGNIGFPAAEDIKGAINVSTGVNLVSTTAGINGAFTGLVAEPHLAPLGNYGGLTPVMPPLPGSPVIDAATAGGGPSTDQCGRPRPLGPLPDIGAVEAVAFSSLGLADTDGDGIPDLLEPALGRVIGNNDAFADGDGDGVSDAEELADMTDPKNPNSYLRITSFLPAVGYHAATNPVFTVQFPTFPGLHYRVEAEQSLKFSSGGSVRQVAPSFTAGGHAASVGILLLPGKDFVRVVRE